MGISKNRVFDANQIQTLINKTQNLMDAADRVINEVYDELVRLSNTLEKIPADVRDTNLKQQVDALKGSIKTDEFQNYRTSMTKSLNRLKETIPKEDKKLGGKLNTTAAAVTSMTNRLKNLIELIPEGADSGSYEDFEKAFQECTRGWEENNKILEELMEAIAAALKGGNNEEVAYGADPVNLNTGNFVYEKEDIRIDGMLPVSMVRSYNAKDKRSGIFGKGWRHSYEVSLLIEEETLIVILADGREETFVRKKDGSFFGENTVNRLVKEQKEYKYLTPEGEIYSFSESGQYLRYKDKFDNILTISYSEERLEKVCCVREQTYLNFVYNQEGKLAQITDNQKRSCFYTYDEQGKLIQAVNAQGETYGYTYNEEGRIESIINAVGTVTVENKYDERGRVIEQKLPDKNKFSINYEDEKQCVTVTERNGSKVSYYHDERYRNVRTVYEDGEEQFAYNRKGQRIRYRDCNGNTTRYAYDGRGNLTQVIDALGVKSNATYDENNHLLKLTVNGVEQIKNIYDSQGNLIESRDALGRTTAFAYQEKGRPNRITRADGSNICFCYDEKGNITGITDPYGNSTTYEYDNLQRVIFATDPRGGKTSYTYDNMNRIISMVSPSGAVTGYRYNQSGKRIEVQRPDGEVLKTEYNILNRPSVVTDAMGNRVTLSYDAMWNISGIKTEEGAEEIYQYDNRNRLSKVTNALGNSVEYGYDGNGNKIWEKGPEGEEVRFIYDAANRLTQRIDSEGNAVQYQYNENGQLTNITDALGNVTSYVYDAAGQKISETNALGNTTLYTYTLLGEIETVTDPSGRVTRYEYQPGGRLNKVYYPNGTWESYTYDTVGNITEKRNSAGAVIHCTYDMENRLITRSIQNEPAELYQYDIMGNLISMTDAAGNVTKYTYDKNGNMTSVEDALGNRTEYVYDKSNQLIKILREGEVEARYDRNPLGQVETVWDALGEKETFRYDRSGRKIETKDRDGYLTRYGYDKNGRLKEIQYGDGRTASYSYNPLGYLEQVKDWLGVTKIENNALGQALKVVGPDGKTVSYSYGKNGERRSMTYPDGKIVYYGYDEALRLTSLKDGEQILTYGYDQNSRLAEKVFPNGVRTSYQYTTLGQLEEMTSNGPEGILEHFSYGYDVLGNRIREEKERKGLPEENGSYTYGYDPMGRLLEVRKEMELLRSYQYDKMGNRIQKTFQGPDGRKQITYGYNEIGQLIQESSNEIKKKYYYDGRGNLTQIQENGIEQYRYQYGALNRLEEAWNSSGKTAKYSYNGMGFRAGRTEGAKQVSYVLDMTREYQNLLYCKEEEKKTSFLWDNGAVLMEREGSVSSFLTDQQGSVLRLLNQEGAVEESYGYDEFGLDLYGNTGKLQPFGYTGYETDIVSGTSFAQAREYQPLIGRFVSEDPIKGFAAQPITLNHYAYCFNNPLILVDRNGAWPSFSDIGEGIGNAWNTVTDAASAVGDFISDHKGMILTGIGITAAAVGSIFAPGVLAAALAGAAIGSTIETGFQAYDIYKSGGNIFDDDAYNYWKIGFSGITGAITGGISGGAPAVASTFGISEGKFIVAGNAVIGGTEAVINSKLEGKELTKWETVEIAIGGGIVGAFSGWLGKTIGDKFNEARFMKVLNIKKHWSKPIYQPYLYFEGKIVSHITSGNKKVFEHLVKKGRVIELFSNLFMDASLEKPSNIMEDLVRKGLKNLEKIFEKETCEG